MGSVQLFIEKMRKTETKSLGIGYSHTVPGADGSLVLFTMFCRLVRPKASRLDSTGLLTNSKFDDSQNLQVENGR